MKVIFDENLSPALARALAELFKGKHEVTHLRLKYGPGVDDVDWIKDLNRDGTWVVISGDRRIHRNKAEQQVFRSSKLIGFFFSRSLQKSSVVKQMERLMAIWENIENQSALVKGGSMFEIPIRSQKLRTL